MIAKILTYINFPWLTGFCHTKNTNRIWKSRISRELVFTNYPKLQKNFHAKSYPRPVDADIKSQKQPYRSVRGKRCSENMQQIYRRTPSKIHKLLFGIGSFIYYSYFLPLVAHTHMCLSELRYVCAYQRVRNVSFSENFAHLLNKWSLKKSWSNVHQLISKSLINKICYFCLLNINEEKSLK